MTEDCGLTKLVEPGDVVMADKGFEIYTTHVHLLAPKKVILNIPPFIRGKDTVRRQCGAYLFHPPQSSVLLFYKEYRRNTAHERCTLESLRSRDGLIIHDIVLNM